MLNTALRTIKRSLNRSKNKPQCHLSELKCNSSELRSWANGATSVPVRLQSLLTGAQWGWHWSVVGIVSLFAQPSLGAEQIYIPYGPLEFSLAVEDLEIFANSGKVSVGLDTYARFLNRDKLEQIRQVLSTRADIGVVPISQFLYSPQGETLLRRAGDLLQTDSRQNGFHALRAAFILSTADEEGLTPLNFLKHFPSRSIRFDSTRGFELIEQLSETIHQTDRAIAQVEEQSKLERQEIPLIPVNQLPDLRQPGSLNFAVQSLSLIDVTRQRALPIDLYLPEQSSPHPVVIISHGLGSDRTTFRYLATHLASYGFAVIVPEHPGSNARQIQNLLSGLANEVTPPQELIDRPLDIRFILDSLEQSHGTQLNLRQVGIIGQSFGAYTALHLSGGVLNGTESLKKACQPFNDVLNLSLLLQCQALRILGWDRMTEKILRPDPRIAAAIAINPLTSTIFAPNQLNPLKHPLMVITGSADTITPALTEQIQPFTQITSENKYLVLLKDGTHFSTLAEADPETSLPLPPQVLGPDPTIGQSYLKPLGVAFFKTHVIGDTTYTPYLRANYGAFLSQPAMPLSLVRTLSLPAENLRASQPSP